MKIHFNPTCFYEETKELFAGKSLEKKNKKTGEIDSADNIQIVPCENGLAIVRLFLEKKNKMYNYVEKSVVFKGCVIEEPLDVQRKLHGLIQLFKWSKYADGLVSTLTIEDNKATLTYDNGVCRLGGAPMVEEKEKLSLDIKRKICEEEDVKCMKDFCSKDATRPQMCMVNFDNGVMCATDAHVMKIKDTEIEYNGMVDTKGYSVDSSFGKYPDYKRVLPTGCVNRLKLNKKTLVKVVSSWDKQYRYDQPMKFSLNKNGELTLSIEDLDYSISASVRLEDQEMKLEPNEYGDWRPTPIDFGLKIEPFLRILKDKDLKDEFYLNYCDPCRAMVIVQEKELWLQMPTFL